MTGSLPPAPEPLPHPVVDNHCHLDIADGPENDQWFTTEEAIAAATEVGVPRIVQIGCDLPGARWAVEAAGAYDALVAGVALHPNEAPRLAATGDLDAALEEIERLAQAHDKVRAVGETGLDHFRTGPEGRAAQAESFRRHIDLAKRLDKTLVIHDRDAHDEVLEVIDSEGAPERWVMHCFSGDVDFARRCLDRGAYLSFAGTVTFKNAQRLRNALVVVRIARKEHDREHFARGLRDGGQRRDDAGAEEPKDHSSCCHAWRIPRRKFYEGIGRSGPCFAHSPAGLSSAAR